jgi:hypothetical protein
MVADEADLEEVYKHGTAPAICRRTRARDHLLLTSVTPASEFLDDLRIRVLTISAASTRQTRLNTRPGLP